jgi:hypothetical protein
MIFYNFLWFFTNLGKITFFIQNKAKLCKHLITTLFFEKNAIFFAENCMKIDQHCDHNIDQRRFLKLSSHISGTFVKKCKCRSTLVPIYVPIPTHTRIYTYKYLHTILF